MTPDDARRRPDRAGPEFAQPRAARPAAPDRGPARPRTNSHGRGPRPRRSRRAARRPRGGRDRAHHGGERPLRARPGHGEHPAGDLSRADPPPSSGRGGLCARDHLQPRRILPDGAGQPAQLPALHVGKPVRPRQYPAGARAHPRRQRAAGARRRALRRLRSRHRRGGRDRPATVGGRQKRAHRLQRARLLPGLAHRARDPRHGDAEGCGRRLLRRRQRAARSHHHGRRHHPRGARDRAHRDGRAQGRDRGARGGGRGLAGRGRHGLRSRKPVLVFSPPPDDDVISMGGVLRKLWENENAIVVAYMTSGNIAVFDHDVRRHLDFVSRAAETLGLDRAAVQRVRDGVEASFERKTPGDVDLPVVQDLKRMIRESEAIAALESVGLPPTAARFLNLPFYRTGEVRKRPIGPEDVAIVRALLEEVRPELVFVAGDLSDPHGTHRMCKAAVTQALAGYDGARPEVWLYRGAWQEWAVTEADVLVPLSQDELRAKVFAIFKHQSQKDTAPFPGGHDDREFWQRVETRNLETAARADRLGLPEYFAMEAYRIVTSEEAEP